MQKTTKSRLFSKLMSKNSIEMDGYADFRCFHSIIQLVRNTKAFEKKYVPKLLTVSAYSLAFPNTFCYNHF